MTCQCFLQGLAENQVGPQPHAAAVKGSTMNGQNIRVPDTRQMPGLGNKRIVTTGRGTAQLDCHLAFQDRIESTIHLSGTPTAQELNCFQLTPLEGHVQRLRRPRIVNRDATLRIRATHRGDQFEFGQARIIPVTAFLFPPVDFFAFGDAFGQFQAPVVHAMTSASRTSARETAMRAASVDGNSMALAISLNVNPNSSLRITACLCCSESRSKA